MRLPGADELFRATTLDDAPGPGQPRGNGGPIGEDAADAQHDKGTAGARTRQPSGRQRHDEKITVYVSPEELIQLETSRLTLRSRHSLAVDRGRIVREALSVVLADLDAKGEDSILVRRLRG